MRLSCASFPLFLLLSVLSYLPIPAMAASQAVQWGNQMLQQKKYDDAIKYFAGAAKADPEDADAFKGLGYAYIYKGDKTKALEYLNYSLELNPGDGALKDYIQQINSSHAASPSGGAAQALQYGNYYLQRKNFDGALGWYSKATQSEPNNARAWQALGNAYYGKKDKSNAVQAWERSVALDPNNTQLKDYLAQLQRSPDTPATQVADTVSESSGANPWLMGGAVLVLGSVMLLAF